MIPEITLRRAVTQTSTWPMVLQAPRAAGFQVHTYCISRMRMMATIWDTVLALPQLLAAMTRPCSTASRRTEVTANSRSMMRMTHTVEARSSFTRQIRADMTRILSAKGSMSLPKLVTKWSRRAILPSKWSV